MEKPLQLFIKYLHQTHAYLGLRKYKCTYNNKKYIIRGNPKSKQQLKPNQEDVEEEGAKAVHVKLLTVSQSKG